MNETGRKELNPSAEIAEVPAAIDQQLRGEVWSHIERSRALIERSQRIIDALRSITRDPR